MCDPEGYEEYLSIGIGLVVCRMSFLRGVGGRSRTGISKRWCLMCSESRDLEMPAGASPFCLIIAE